MAETIKLGNNNWATKEGNMLAYNDENGNFKSIELDFARSSSATVLKRNGLISDVAINEPRVSFEDSVNGAFKLEPQSTNLIPYSEDFSQWNIQNSSISINSTTSPNGQLKGSLFTSLIDYGYINITSSNGTCASIFVKGFEGQSSVGSLVISGRGIGFTINNEGLLTINNPIGYSAARNLKVKKYSNGWYRVSFDWNSSAAYLLASSQANNKFYIFGAQLEEGSYATSYIPTTGTAVTRTYDSINKTGLSSYINSIEGVLYLEMSALFNDGSARAISLSDGTNTNRLYISYNANSNTIFCYISSASLTFSHTITDTTVFQKIALKYKQNDFSLFVNGAKVDSSLSGSSFPLGTLDRWASDSGAGSSVFYGNIKDLGVYNTALTDLELQTLTTI